MPLRQSLRVGALPAASRSSRGRDEVPAARRARAAVRLQPDVRRAAARSSTRPTILTQRMPVEQAVAAMEECGAPMVSIAGGEPLMHPEIDELVGALVGAQEVRLPVHQRACCCASSCDRFTSSRRRYFAFAVHIDGLRERHDESVVPGRRLRRGGRGRSRCLQDEGLPGHHQHDVLHHRHAADRHRRARLPQRRPRASTR